MADSPRILVDLVVVATLECFVTKEVDGCVVHSAGQILVVLDVLQAVRLVPACREDIEGDLTANRVAMNRVNGEFSYLDSARLTSS